MKKYFAKWLPVEGEIKEGDTYQVTGLLKVHTLICEKGEKPLKHWQKVKLFLCSRDIQVGDKVVIHVPVGKPPYIYKEDIVTGYNKEEDVLEFETFTVGKDFCSKVIGEISSDATWVKEGDEFDDTQLGFHTGSGFIQQPWSKLDLEAGFKLLKKGTWKVSIKGPCGHFH